MKLSWAVEGTIKDIQKNLKERRGKIVDRAYRLKQLNNDYYPRIAPVPRDDQGRPVGWTDKVKAVYKDIGNTRITVESTSTSEPWSLATLLVKFQDAVNEDDAVTEFENQCQTRFWATMKVDPVDETQEIRKMAMQISKEEKRQMMENYGNDKLHQK